MGLKYYLNKFSNLNSKDSIRLWIPFSLSKSKYKYERINNYLLTCQSGSRPKGGISELDYGEAISLGGEQIDKDGTVNLNNIPYVSFDYYDNVSKGKIKNNDILLCKDGALTGKTCMVDIHIFNTEKVMCNEHIYILRGNKNIEQKFLFYYTRTELFQSQVKDLAYKKKAQPGLNTDHFKKIKIPAISLQIQKSILKKIEPIENSISQFKSTIIPETQIINNMFTDYFSLNIEQFIKLKKITNSSLPFSQFSNNIDLRYSVKYHRKSGQFVYDELGKISNKKIKDFISEPIILGKSISPENYDENGNYFYISMFDIKSWYFDKENCKTISDYYYSSNQKKTVKKDDIILARSGEGTIGKVAIIDDGSIEGIFADFTMRIRLKNCNQKFVYYYFRTDYFQYLVEINKKGLGNNTNIFPNQLQEFPILDIPLKEQNKIVKNIETEIEKQNYIKEQIETERKKIDDIIMNSIK